MAFRSDVEGLRALAIVLVVAHHCDVPFLRGGYIGVDVFFVISGFVITRMLLAELRDRGRLNFAEFYARRAARLLPALMVMLLTVSVVGSVLLAPFEQVDEAKDALLATAWVSNIGFARSQLDYFGPAIEGRAQLHTWSLGVEEQFYLIWPALLMFLLGAWHWQGGRHSIRRLSVGLAITAIVSLSLFLLLAATKPLWAFYLMPGRIWQFALGALVCCVEHQVSRREPAPWHHMLSWVGLGLVAAFVAWPGEGRAYPSALVSIPSLGTAMVLLAGSLGTSPGAANLLGCRLAQWVGARSYSWYLWHWPLLAIGGWLLLQDGLASSLLLAAVSLGLAALSYRFIEAPARAWLRSAFSARTLLLLALAATAAVSLVLLGWMWSAMHWSRAPEQARYVAARQDAPVIYRMGCDTWIHSGEVTACDFPAEGATRRAVLVGDSVAAQWVPALLPIFARAGWDFRVITKASCPMVAIPNHVLAFGTANEPYRACEAWRTKALRTIREQEADIVIVGSSAIYSYSMNQWRDGTQRVLDAISSDSRQVFVLAPTPELPFDSTSCLARRDWRSLAAPVCEFPLDRAGLSGLTDALQSAADEVRGARVIDLNDLICPGGHCRSEYRGEVVFRDRRHLTASFSSRLDPMLEQRFLSKAIRTAEAD